tara:strand:+ start:1227 stop:1868 length:642 start_codon:yes stop_codon:yes gene_type:complete
MALDAYLSSIPDRKANSVRSLPRILREAYTYEVPALIMKSSTDRLSVDGDYSFFLGTPDASLRRIASWLITKNSETPEVLASILPSLWKRHGREDLAMAALLLANIDHGRMGTNPWRILEDLIRPREPIEGLLMCVEEILRSGRKCPDEEKLCSWLEQGGVTQTLSLLCIHASIIRGRDPTEKELELVAGSDYEQAPELVIRVRDRILNRDQV